MLSFPATIPSYAAQPLHTQRISKSIREFLCNELHFQADKKTYLLAVSGGADSLALLCLWAWLKPVYGYTFSVAHVDHLLRPQSTAEANAVAALCAAWHIPCVVHRVDIAALANTYKEGIEERARKERYSFFEKQRQQCQADYICLGHHIGDVQEDIFMRLFRGAGWPALGGMVALDAQRRILRPLLMQEPQELRKVLHSAGLTWIEDASNKDTRYTRNRIRHSLLPLVYAENPSFSQKARDLWQLAQYDAQYWHDLVNNMYTQHAIHDEHGAISFTVNTLLSLHKTVRLRLYKHVLHSISSQGQARTTTLLHIDTALVHNVGGKVFQLAGGVHVQLHKKMLTFYTSK